MYGRLYIGALYTMRDNTCSDFHFPTINPATTLIEVWDVFDPTRAVDPASEFYIPRIDPKLQNLSFAKSGTAPAKP